MHPGKTRLRTPRPLLIALLCLAPLAALALAACGSCGGGDDELTLYNGQHEQTTALLVKDFERQTGIKVRIRSADEATLANQIVQEGSNSPADVFYAENTPALENLGEKGLLAPVAAGDARRRPARATARHAATGSASRRASRSSSTTRRSSGPRRCRARSSSWPSRTTSGKVGFAPSETDFQPLVDARSSKLHGRAAAESWLKALQAATATSTRTTRRSSPRSTTARARSGRSTTTTGTGCAGSRAKAAPTRALHHYAQGDAGNLIVVSGAAVLRSSHKQAGCAEAARLPRQRRRPAGARRTATATSTRCVPGVAPPAGLPPLSSFGPSALTPAQLGDGREALELEQKLGLL